MGQDAPHFTLMVHSLDLVLYEVFKKLSGFWEVFAYLELKSYGVKVLNDLRPSLFGCCENIVVALDFADVILCNVQRVRVPLVQVRNKEFSAFQSFHQPMRCLLLLYLYFYVVC